MSADRQHPPKRFQPRAPMAYDAGMEARVAVLEQIARDNRDIMARLEAKMDAGFAKMEAKIDGVRDKQERDLRLVVGMLIATAIGLAGLVAHGFRWIP